MKEQYDRVKENARYQMELLSYLINDDSLYIKSIDIIRAEMFTGINRQIFNAYVSLIQKSKSPDVVNISTEGNIEFDKVLEVATTFSGSPTEINSLLFELYQYMAGEKFSKLAGFISNQVTAGTDSEIIKEHILSELRSLDFGNTSKVITMEQGISMLYKIMDNNRKSTICTGIPVGLSIVDKHMGGLQKGDLIILAGETSHWKTSLALSMLYNSGVLFSQKCGIISHEMTVEQLTARLSAISTNISSKHLLTGKMSDFEINEFGNKVGGLMKSNIIIQDYINTELANTISAIRLMVIQCGVSWVVVENAGNITIKDIRNNEELRTSTVSRALKSIAKELGITVILISHLSRQKEGGRRQPDLARLKHSGQLESDADVVMFTYKADLHGWDTFSEADSDDISDSTENRLKVFIAKGRNYGLAKSFPYANANNLYVVDYLPPEYNAITPNNSFDNGSPNF